MNKRQIKRILRYAVLGSLPASALAAGCAPCISTPRTTKSPAQGTYSRQLEQGVKLDTFEKCAERCKAFLEKESLVQNNKVENFKANTCDVTQEPGQDPVIHCDVSFVSVNTTTISSGIGCPVAGRMPVGLQVQKQEGVSEVGYYFAEMASMEDAAVTAFRYLTQELEAYRAPQELIQLAQQAVQEEIEHTQLATMLAASYGASPWEISVDPFQLRSLEEIALENATEGCVRETFASACAMWQSIHAKDESVRLVMQRVGEEEAGHADLSWAIDAWIQPQLTPEQQQRCKDAQEQTIQELEQSFAAQAPETVREAAGLPNAEDSAILFQELRRTLWV